jgi:glycosyltransferase involved in cell wall biosynthesis
MASLQQSPRLDILASTLVTGGAERVIEALARGLPENGFSVRVLCLHEPGDVGASIARSGTPLVSRFARFRFDPFAIVRLSHALGNDRRAVLFVLDHHDAIFAGALASRVAGVKHRLIAVHSMGLWGKRSSFSRSDRFVLGAYERIIALANSHADYLVEREHIERERVRVVPNGVDTRRFRPAQSAAERESTRAALAIPKERFVVSIVAALRPEKNHSMLLEAAAKIVERRTDFLFLIVGEGREGARLLSKARKLSLGEQVRFMGRRSDVPRILTASDASVLCSWPVVETFPLAVLEAMACGVPVVATEVGAVREMLVPGEEGFIIGSGDVDALVRALLDLAERPEMRIRVGMQARKRVERDFTVEQMIKHYIDCINEIIT